MKEELTYFNSTSKERNAAKRYEKLKQDPKLYKKRIKRQLAWTKRNPKKDGRLYSRQMYHISKELGNCVLCHKPKEISFRVHCNSCRIKNQEYCRRYYSLRRMK